MSLSPSYALRLIALIGCIFLAVLIIAGVSLFVIEGHLLKQSGQSLSLSAINIAQEISRFLDERYHALKVLTRVPILQTSNNLDSRQAFLDAIHQEEPQFRRLTLVEPGGHVLASTDPSLTGAVAGDVGKGGSPVSDGTVLVKDVSGEPEPGELILRIFMQVPVVSARKPGTMLVADLKVSILETVFSQAQEHNQQPREDPNHLEWQLLRRDGQVLIDSLLREEGKVSLTALELPSASLVFQGAPGFVEEVHRRRQVPVLTGFAQLPDNILNRQWGVLVRMDRADVLPAIHYTLIKIGGGLSLILIPLLGFLVWLTLQLNREHVRTLEVEAQYRHIFERSPEGIYRSTISGQLELANPAMARMFGYEDPQAMVAAFQNPEQELYVDPERRATFLQELMAHGEVHGFESQVGTCQGERRWVSETAYLVTERSGAPQCIEGTMEDITERRHAEMALQEAQDRLLQQQKDETKRVTQELEKVRRNIIRQTKLAALGQLSGNIAHELRNPLGTIRNAIFLLKRKLPVQDANVQHYLEVAEKEIGQSDKIIHDLLKVAGGKQPIKGLVALEPLLRDVWEREVSAEGYDLAVDLAPQPFFLWGDHNQLQQVFRNLMENAIQAMSSGSGQVTVTARHEDGVDAVKIHDAGMGIATEDRQRVFDPLFSQKLNGHMVLD